MKENAFRAADRMLAHEGGFVDHPNDPGGATNLGVTIGTLKRLGIDKDGDGDSDIVDLKALTKDDARQVFKTFYWDTVKGDLLPSGVDYAVADFAYNSGPSRAARHLQKVVGTKQDGVVGTITLAAVDETVAEHGAAWIVKEVCDSRMAFLRGLGTWDSFGKGWERRVNQVRSVGIEWANEAPEKSKEAPMGKGLAQFIARMGIFSIAPASIGMMVAGAVPGVEWVTFNGAEGWFINGEGAFDLLINALILVGGPIGAWAALWNDARKKGKLR